MINYQLNEEFLDNTEKFTEKKLSQRSTINQFIEIINNNNKIEKFEELTFTAKYVNGLFRIIKTAQTNQQISNFDQIKNDFSDNLQKVISILKELISGQNISLVESIENQYLTAGESQFENLLLLINDLDQIKKYLNFIKRA